VPRTAGWPRDQPASALINVLLPAPLAPTMPTMRPAGTATSTPSTAVLPP